MNKIITIFIILLFFIGISLAVLLLTEGSATPNENADEEIIEQSELQNQPIENIELP